ncbi:T9SS type A sorting domain-containing protein, partial [bacterium]|nr:T9SS type A sorting domain-containing protein [bacterium]
LTISEIIKPGVDFTLANLPALPLTLATFQSINLDVCFTPQKGGLSVDSIVIVSNAKNSPRQGVKLEGTGAQINRVQPDILYAVSASSLYTIDPSTGKATLVGPLSMTQVQGLALNPLTLELIGITATTSDMTCYRIDSQSGRSFLLQKISLGSSRAIAFKGDTLFAGSNSGKLYRINLGTNSVSQIGSVANINYYGLVVHPGTGQLYAAAQSTSSAIKDKIFIINTANGDTVSVGATGDNSITQAIAFSPSGILYGLKTGWTGNTLVTIDAKTGAATLVGSTGVSGLRGLVISPGTTAVKEQAKHDVTPQQFVLSQNYPNPFNPSTTIEFSLQAPEQVSLKVYSILGHELAELIHDTLPAGVHKAVWHAKDCANGIYYIVLEADGCREVRKAILMK